MGMRRRWGICGAGMYAGIGNRERAGENWDLVVVNFQC